MHLYEYEAKDLLRQYGAPVPKGVVLHNRHDVESISTGGVLKAQVHAGGRGKAGGVVVHTDAAVLREHGLNLLGKRLVTQQTDDRGELVRSLYWEERYSVQEEYYVSFVVNRAVGAVELLASRAGGIHIENDFASQGLRRIVAGYWHMFYTRQLGVFLNLPSTLWKELHHVMSALYRAFCENDAILLEVNPLVRTTDDRIVLLDAKMTLDSNASIRSSYKGADTDATPEERKAQAFNLNYVRLQGHIGCIVNGAGLAMGTMDLIAFCGGRPSNFLDVGGGTTVERVQAATEIVLSDLQVRAILVNIVGGIVRCDVLAEGLIRALLAHVNQRLPTPAVIIRLQGSMEAEGKSLMHRSGLPFTIEDDLLRATRCAVEAASASVRQRS